MITHEHTRACFAAGCPAVKADHEAARAERVAELRPRFIAALTEELDALGLTPGWYYADSLADAALSAMQPEVGVPLVKRCGVFGCHAAMVGGTLRCQEHQS